MSLRLFEKTLAHLPPSLHALYVADNKHGWRLDLSDLDEHVAGLKNALATERAKVKEQRHLISVLRLQTEVISVGGD